MRPTFTARWNAVDSSCSHGSNSMLGVRHYQGMLRYKYEDDTHSSSASNAFSQQLPQTTTSLCSSKHNMASTAPPVVVRGVPKLREDDVSAPRRSVLDLVNDKYQWSLYVQAIGESCNFNSCYDLTSLVVSGHNGPQAHSIRGSVVVVFYWRHSWPSKETMVWSAA